MQSKAHVSFLAAEDLKEWVKNHDPKTGFHHLPGLRISDVSQATEVKAKIIAALQADGKALLAQRLQQPGSAGYPDQDVFPYLAACLGGEVVLQTGSTQEVFGTGPLVAHLWFCTVGEPGGSRSGHFGIVQSWTAIAGARKRTWECAMAATEPPQGPRPKEIPPFLNSLSAAAGGLSARPEKKDVAVDDGGTAERVLRCQNAVLGAIPDATPGVVKIGVVLLLTHRLRLLDMSMKEHVEIIYAVEGGDHMRAHNGTLYLYSNGAWAPFSGVFPVAVLTRMRCVLLRLEGLVRLFRDVPRTSEGVLTAMSHLLEQAGDSESWYARLEDAVIQPRGEDDEGGNWPRTLASAISRCSAALQELLAGKRCVPFLIEWCDTRIDRAAGFAANDACYIFDSASSVLEQVPKSPSNNIYMFLDHNMHDPVKEDTPMQVPFPVPSVARLVSTLIDELYVCWSLNYDISALQEHVTRLAQFFQSTFFENEAALECHFAALALVLRGRNIDRAFWTLGAGGVGQSLLSHLIATVFGRSHAFVDMNLYFTDDELRKQGELLAGKAVVTGQEMPSGGKEMRDDLYKKHVSADPVSCRLPYAVVTKQAGAAATCCACIYDIAFSRGAGGSMCRLSTRARRDAGSYGKPAAAD